MGVGIRLGARVEEGGGDVAFHAPEFFPIAGGSCHKDHFFVATKVLSCDKIMFVATKKNCRDKSFAATSILLLR